MDDAAIANLVQHLMELKVGIADIGARLRTMEKFVAGNGQPGLAQKVEELQGAKNWTWGVGAAVVFLAGIAEWLFHRGR